MPVAATLRPDVIVLAADVDGPPLVSLMQQLRAASVASKIIMIGEKATLDADTLLEIEHLGAPRPSYLTWEDLRPEAVLDCLPVVAQDDLLVGSRGVLETFFNGLERR